MAKINSWRTSFDIEGEPTGGGNANVFFVKDKSTDKVCTKRIAFQSKQ